MNRGLAEGFYGRYAVLGHEQVTADADGATLPNPPDDNRLRRIVIRPKGDITYKLDGTDPTTANAFYALADEVMVLDCGADGVRLAGANVDCRIIYLGT